jgi:hypothetical protein
MERMKRRRTAMLVAALLGGMMLLGPAYSQHPTTSAYGIIPTPPLPPGMATPAPVVGTPVMGSPATITFPAMPGGMIVDSAPSSCSACEGKSGAKSIDTTKKITHVTYTSKEVEACGPGGHCLRDLHNPDCHGAVYTKTVLVKKVSVEEKPGCVCSAKAESKPACSGTPYGSTPCTAIPGVPMPSGPPCASGVLPAAPLGPYTPVNPPVYAPAPPMPPAPAPMPLPKGAAITPHTNDSVTPVGGIALPPIR